MSTVTHTFPIHPEFTLEDLQAVADKFDAHAGFPASRVVFGWHKGRRRYLALVESANDGLEGAAFRSLVLNVRQCRVDLYDQAVEALKDYIRRRPRPLVTDEIPVMVDQDVGPGFIRFECQR